MQLHELIDREDPRCLYCKSECDIQLTGNYILPGSSSQYNVDMLTCRKCKERFDIHWIDEATNVVSFAFSCKKMAVFHAYGHGFIIGIKKELLWSYEDRADTKDTDKYLPPFDIDFSDKKKLHNKLKTYLLFS